MQEKELDTAFGLGTWLGRRQAFSMVAGRCSAADAQCLHDIREKKQYRALGMNWETFCKEHAGISRALADKVIRQVEEFGNSYFLLAAVTGVTPNEYRSIAGAVSEQGLLHAGQTIPIVPENAPRLTAAIQELCQQPEPAAALPASLERSFRRAEKLLKGAYDELERLQASPLEMRDRLRLQSVLGSGIQRLQMYVGSLRL